MTTIKSVYLTLLILTAIILLTVAAGMGVRALFLTAEPTFKSMERKVYKSSFQYIEAQQEALTNLASEYRATMTNAASTQVVELRKALTIQAEAIKQHVRIKAAKLDKENWPVGVADIVNSK